MKVTVDANVLFSALLKKGATRKLWFDPEMKLYAPEVLLDEFKKYSGFLQKKFNGTEEEFRQLSEKLLVQVRFVADNQLKPFLPAAAFLLDDEKDWLYLACALKEDTIIWSNDSGFKRQARVKVKTTTELMKETGLL